MGTCIQGAKTHGQTIIFEIQEKTSYALRKNIQNLEAKYKDDCEILQGQGGGQCIKPMDRWLTFQGDETLPDFLLHRGRAQTTLKVRRLTCRKIVKYNTFLKVLKITPKL